MDLHAHDMMEICKFHNRESSVADKSILFWQAASKAPAPFTRQEYKHLKGRLEETFQYIYIATITMSG